MEEEISSLATRKWDTGWDTVQQRGQSTDRAEKRKEGRDLVLEGFVGCVHSG